MGEKNKAQDLVKRKKLSKRYLFIVFVLVVYALALYIYSICFGEPETRHDREFADVTIKSGMSFDAISEMLLAEQVIANKTHFKITALLMGYTNKIKAGRYNIPSGISNYHILEILVSGKVALTRVTIPEGKTHRFIASLLQQKLAVDSTEFAELVHDTSFIRNLGIDAPTLEGYLFPDTYYLTDGSSAKQVISILVNQFKQHFPDTIRDRDPELNLSQHQMVILASLIEGEAMLDTERTLISALYRNRLKKGYLLQCDPTIQYLLPEPRRLLNRDLEIDSPYNTYKTAGLPPGPINNPGKQSLLAAAFPEDVDYLYMVARGDGGHTFSRTHSGHLSAKKKFDAYRREVYRKNRNK
ncbi:endolytic transglycosylase MltG [candidate division KSB1 bacterium]|nr:endolytic transglycosylase MltG [candidate division KSB1 bacterium]